jgi:uncharacterized DUF497 family protein
MKEEVIYCFNPEKNKKLIDSRGISFEEIISLLETQGPLDVLENPKPEYRHQKIYIIDFSGYIYLVPFVEKESQILLITIIPSRKATKKYLLHAKEKNYVE